MSENRSTQPAGSQRSLSPGTILAGGLIVAVILITIAVFFRGSGDDDGMPGMDMQGMDMGAAGTATMDMEMGAGTTATMDMDMDHEGMAGMGGMDMRPVDTSNAEAADPDARGNQPLTPTITPDGVKEFELRSSVIRWSILPDVEIGAYAYNGQVSGPEIRVTQGDSIRIRFRNDLPEPTSVHWHGLILPNEMDGAGGITQPPVASGEEFTYEFTVEQAGTYFYHTHVQADRQQTLGLYGALIVEPTSWASGKPFDSEYTLLLGEWKIDDAGQTLPAMNQPDVMPNFFTINGKSYPATETIKANVGDRIRLRFIGSGQFVHPMHVHGGPFEIVETDGNPVPPDARLLKDTVLVGPGERYDVEWVAQRPGKWLIHCHINDHLTNNGEEVDGAGGLTMVIEVAP